MLSALELVALILGAFAIAAEARELARTLRVVLRVLGFLLVLLVPSTAHAIAGLGSVSPILGPKPIVWSQNTDFCSAGGLVGSNLRITGTQLAGVTAVTVGGYAATVVTTNVNQLVVTTPIDTAHPTDGESSVSTVSVTNPYGGLTSSIWFLPSGWTAAGTGGAWSAQDVAIANCRSGLPSPCVQYVFDQSGNGNHLQPRGATAPPYATQWFATGGGSKGNLAYWVHSSANTGSNNDGLESWPDLGTKLPTMGTTVDWFIAARYTSTAAECGLLGTGGSSTPPGLYIPSSSAIKLEQLAASGVNGVTLTQNADFFDESYMLTSSPTTFQSLNAGTPVSGSAGALSAQSGVFVGGWFAFASSFIWNGRVYRLFLSPTAYSTTGRANFAAYFNAIGL
jgi:hypothetical protein